MADARVVLVTGASSGIGQATARLLAREGFRVFGTSRKPAAGKVDGVEMVPLDVTSEATVRECVETVLNRAGRVDGLVNNAGHELAGAVEETALEDAKAQFETNFFGTHRMTRAVLPHMRARRSGHLVTIGSLAGVIPIPFVGFYSATKFALEGYTEALRHEVRPFGIRVSIVEPSFMRTGLQGARRWASEEIPDYGPWRSRAMGRVTLYENRDPHPEKVAAVVLRILRSPNPRLRHPVGRNARAYALGRRLMAEPLFERGTRRFFALDSKR
ncbi:MAG: SDR family NAD(P)-dependent oxidoreductase [Halobacteria archaeon]